MKKLLLTISIFVLILPLLWLLASGIILYYAPNITFETQKSKDENYGIEVQRDFFKNKAGNNLEMIIVPKENSHGVILYFHGNVGRLGYILRDASKQETVYSPAYPGYSQSEGNPTSDNIYETVDLSMQYLFSHGYKQEDITVLGHSLGGSPAVYVASKYPKLKKVIVVNTFYSMQAMCEIKFSFLCALGGNFLNTSKFAPDVKVRIVQFHDPEDALIPFDQGAKLFKELGTSDKKFLSHDGNHANFNVDNVLKSDL